jgi:hypothetical protein
MDFESAYFCYKHCYSFGLFTVTATNYKFVEMYHSNRPALATPLVSSFLSALHVAQLLQEK